MGGRRDQGRPVEADEARAHGNDPEAVEVHRTGDGGSGEVGRTEGRRAERETVTGDDTSQRSTGGAAPSYSAGRQGSSPNLVARRDSARWGPIWAGLLTAITTFLLLQLLALGIGIMGIGNNAGGAWVSAIIGLIAFFTGGAVAGMTSAVRGAATGFLNGFLVWALGTVLILVLSALGLGQIFGALGNVVGQINPASLGGAAQNAPNVDPQQALSAVRTGAIGAFFGLLVSAIAAALGGYLGGRSKEPIGHMAQDND